MRVTRITSTQQLYDLCQHSTLINKVYLPFSNQLSQFLPQPAFSMSSSASLSSFDLQPPFLPLTFNLEVSCPSQEIIILSLQHMTIPTNTVCHRQLIYGFFQTQHEHQICRSFSVLELYSTHCSHHGSFCPL